MGIIAWIVFGLITGIIANALDPRPSQGGLIGAMLLGIVGALVGGFLGSIIFGVGISGFNLSSFVVSVVGALVPLVLGKMMTGRKVV